MNNELLVGKILRAFKSVGLTISGFAKREGFNVKMLYNLSARKKISDEFCEQFIYCLNNKYPKEYENIMRIIEVTE